MLAGVIKWPQVYECRIRRGIIGMSDNKEVKKKAIQRPPLKDLEGEGYTEISGSREQNVKGVLGSYVTPTAREKRRKVLTGPSNRLKKQHEPCHSRTESTVGINM